MGAQFVPLFRTIRKRTKMEQLLEVKNLSVSIDGLAGEVQAVRDVSFSLKKGEVLAIVGESGCGKSMKGNSLFFMKITFDFSEVRTYLQIFAHLGYF